MTKDAKDTAAATKADVSRLEEGISRLSDRLDAKFATVDERFNKIDHGLDRIHDRFDQVDERFDYIDEQLKVDSERMTALLATVGNLQDGLQHVQRDTKTLKAWARQNAIVLTDHEKRLQVVEQRLEIKA